MLTKRKGKIGGKSQSKLNTVAFLSLKVLRKGGEVKRGESREEVLTSLELTNYFYKGWSCALSQMELAVVLL